MIFNLVANTLFTNLHLSQEATYTPVNGEPVTVRVVKASPKQEEVALFQTHSSVTPYIYDVRVTDVPTPQDGAMLVVNGESYRVRSYQKDEEQLVWRLNLDKA
jgi:hypothetical protein